MFWFCLHVCNDFVREDHFDIGVGVSSVMSDGATRVFVIFRVHEFFIVIVAFGGPCFDMLTKVLSSSHNVIVASTNHKKIVDEVHNVGVCSMDRQKNVVHVANFDIGRSGFVMGFEYSFWNTMFERDLPK